MVLTCVYSCSITKFPAYHLCVASALPQSRWCLHATVVEDSILYYQSYCQSPQPGERNKCNRKSYHRFLKEPDIYTSEIIPLMFTKLILTAFDAIIYHKGRHKFTGLPHLFIKYLHNLVSFNVHSSKNFCCFFSVERGRIKTGYCWLGIHRFRYHSE